uniref:Uncharacterized protein n=1 Tax=Arundo donax TaxID=35708 RepID=A0A0A9C5Y4_ARUDO
MISAPAKRCLSRKEFSAPWRRRE